MNLNLGHTRLIISTARAAGLSLPQIAYVLATAFWETARSMQPVEEAYYLGARAEKYRKGLRYYPWHGRGFAQLTWEANYKKAGAALGVDLTSDPSKAMEPSISARILVQGMKGGWFTGKKLADYINDTKTDFVGARRIVNGTDEAAEIAALARDYAKALASAPESTAAKPNWLAAILSLLRSIFGGAK